MPFHAMMQAGDLQTYVENYPLYHCILYLCIQWNTHLTYSMDQHGSCLLLCMDPTEAISLAEWCLTFFLCHSLRQTIATKDLAANCGMLCGVP